MIKNFINGKSDKKKIQFYIDYLLGQNDEGEGQSLHISQLDKNKRVFNKLNKYLIENPDAKKYITKIVDQMLMNSLDESFSNKSN